MKILSIVPNLYEFIFSAEQKIRMLVTKQLTVAIDFYIMQMTTVNCLVTNILILQNILFCVQQLREIYTGLDKFCVNYPFNVRYNLRRLCSRMCYTPKFNT